MTGPPEPSAGGSSSAGDPGEEALRRSIEGYRDHLSRLAEAEFGGRRGAAGASRDLVSEAILAARRELSSFRGRTASELGEWLEAILRRVALGEAGGVAPGDDVEVLGGVAYGPSRVAPGGEWSRRGATPGEREAVLLAALERLPQPEQDTIKWHHRDGEPFGKVADRLGIPIEEAQRLWCRALQRLQRSLGRDDDG